MAFVFRNEHYLPPRSKTPGPGTTALIKHTIEPIIPYTST